MLKHGTLYRIIHDPNGRNKGYNFESKHIIRLIKMAYECPKQLLDTIEKNCGRTLSKVLDNNEER